MNRMTLQREAELARLDEEHAGEPLVFSPLHCAQ